MLSIAKTICLVALFHAVSTVASSALRRRSINQKFRRRAHENSLLCLILQVHMRTSSGVKDHLECDLVADDGGPVTHGLQIQLPPALVENHRKELHRGEWYVLIVGAKVEQTQIEGYGMLNTSVSVPENADIITVPPEEGDGYVQAVQGTQTSRYVKEDRKLAGASVRKLLVARISTWDVSPSYSSNDLKQFYFNLSTYSVARQFALCSAGLLWIKGFNGTNSSVVDVIIPGRASSFNQQTLMAAALPGLLARLNTTSITGVADNVAFIFPPGLQGGVWYGFGTVGSYRSVFSDKFGGIPNTIMHEIGHNLGLNHAGLGYDQYNDLTDIMGYGDFAQFGPSKCFNGKHFWDLGWFQDRSITVDPFQHTIVQLACFVDYRRTDPNQYVVVNVGNYYLVFNQAKGVNSGTGAVPNQVTIVQTGGLYTQRVGAISNTTGPFQVPNYRGSSATLIIKVCQMVTLNKTNTNIQVAVVSIGINNGACS